MRHKKFKEAFSDNTAGIKKKHLFDNLAQKGMCSNMQMDTKWMTKWLKACINVMGLNVDFWTVPILKHTSRYFCAMLGYKFKKKNRISLNIIFQIWVQFVTIAAIILHSFSQSESRGTKNFWKKLILRCIKQGYWNYKWLLNTPCCLGYLLYSHI